ncbi:MAG: DUF3025 domain-containing protein [Deltaproteobacteria bacterium]|nr:DUF3025 domain-containing protein [Deltaproteobacteria bacterium]
MSSRSPSIAPLPQESDGWKSQVQSLLALCNHPLLRELNYPLALLSTLSHPPSVEDIDTLFSPLARIRFILQHPSSPRPKNPAQSYDGLITLCASVPTRPYSLHDLANALMWCIYPKAKRSLHKRQFEVLVLDAQKEGRVFPTRRSRLRDLLTMFDEGGVILRLDPFPCLQTPIRSSEELSSIIDQSSKELFLFGHAIVEHLVLSPNSLPSIRVKVLLVPSVACDLDTYLANLFASEDAALREAMELPSLRLGDLAQCQESRGSGLGF